MPGAAEHDEHAPIIIQLELKNTGLPEPFDLTPVTPFGTAELDALAGKIRAETPRWQRLVEISGAQLD